MLIGAQSGLPGVVGGAEQKSCAKSLWRPISHDMYVEEAINSGAMGYLIKQTSSDNVCTAIREVQKGNTFFSPSIPKRLHKRNRKK